MEMHKRCIKCGETKELSEFYFRKDSGEYRNQCKICRNTISSKYAIINKDTIEKYQKIYNREYRLKNRDTHAKMERTRKHNDIQYRIASNLRNRLYHSVKGKKRAGSAIINLGCSMEYLKRYLESKFVSGMSWENYGLHGWHIDHIIPLSSFDLTNKEELVKACHYTNLQPLWAQDNLKKGAKVI